MYILVWFIITNRKKRKKGSNSSHLDASISKESHKPEDEDSIKAHEITMSRSKKAMEIFAKELISLYDKIDDIFSKFEKDFKDHFENRFVTFYVQTKDIIIHPLTEYLSNDINQCGTATYSLMINLSKVI